VFAWSPLFWVRCWLRRRGLTVGGPPFFGAAARGAIPFSQAAVAEGGRAGGTWWEPHRGLHASMLRRGCQGTSFRCRRRPAGSYIAGGSCSVVPGSPLSPSICTTWSSPAPSTPYYLFTHLLLSLPLSLFARSTHDGTFGRPPGGCRYPMLPCVA